MPPQGHRRQDSEARGHRTSGHRKRKASESRRVSTDERRRRASGTRALSADALAQLNASNASNANTSSGYGGNAATPPRAQGDDRRRRRRDERQREEERRRDKEIRDERRRRDERQLDADRQPPAKKKRHKYYTDNGDDRRDGTDDEEAAPNADAEADADGHGHRRGGYTRVEAGGRQDRRHRSRRDRRIPSSAMLEEGRSRGISGGHLRGGRGGDSSSSNHIMLEKEQHLYYTKNDRPGWWTRKRLIILCCLGGVGVVVMIVVIAVVVSKKKSGSSSSSTSGSGSTGGGGGGGGLSSISPSSIPAGSPSWLNPFEWADTKDFNLTYTNATVGGLPIMGLNTSYDDSASANANRPALNKKWGSYATTPARGVNLGGWLSLEPFITPSLFNYASSLGVVDEWTLCTHLGATACAKTLEAHYATFVTESTFAEIAAAGLDHVRIPFSYWAVEVYDGDPYLFRTSWRYLLRGIEWARRHGLRVSLDLHGLPGSQNGWNHSGRQGTIGWMSGADGARNVQRSLDVHDRLSTFFAQARYANIVTHYGLANEPRMTSLPLSDVMNWTQTAAALVRRNGLGADRTAIVFGDGFYGLDKWQGQPNDYGLVLDVHQYEIFNNAQLVYTHEQKIKYACSGWSQQTLASMDTATGFGPTIVAEWSQADTDCATFLGNVNNGNRWTGTYNVGNASLNALTPMCPTTNSACDCSEANAADPSRYSTAYKQFLLTFAEAQMHSFEKGWGWWYWTWDTESAPQWSYKKGLAAGILPKTPAQRSFQCDTDAIPSFSDLPETY